MQVTKYECKINYKCIVILMKTFVSMPGIGNIPDINTPFKN